MSRFCIMILFLFLSGTEIFAQKNRIENKQSNVNLVLSAQKGSRINYFHKWMTVQIVFSDSLNVEQKVKGYITNLNKNSIEISSFKGMDTSVSWINASEIEKVKKIARAERQKVGWAAAGTVAYSGFMYAIMKKPLGPYSYIVFIPAFATAYILMYYYPATFLFDEINEKNKNKGWEFVVVNY